MKTWKSLAAAGGLIALSGCGIANVDTIRTLQPTGGDFNTALSREYQELSLFEADEMYDWISATRYAERGLAAANGELVLPFELADFDLPSDMIDEMSRARAGLMEVLDASARTKLPAAAADAQGKFDCWVEQQEENHQPQDIAACRTAFEAAMGIIRAELAGPRPEPQAEPAGPVSFTVLFGFDDASLTPEAQDVVIQAIATARRYGSPAIIIGHTDTSGSAAYNMALSERRAQEVAAAFIKSGISDVRITVRAVGEEDLAVATPDGVREAANRRVTITIAR